MKEYKNTSPVFADAIQIVETTDPAHADNINMAPTQLLQNTLSNRGLIERMLAYSYDSDRGRVVNLLPFNFDNGKLTVPEGMGSFEDDALVLEVAI